MAVSLPQEVVRWLERQGYGQVVEVRSQGGGCINQAYRLRTTSGARFFLKVNPSAPSDMFLREAEGLKALAVPQGPTVPTPYLWGENFLLMEDLCPAPRQPNYWEAFGRAMARLHQHQGPKFGFAHDNYIGSTPQPNPWTDDGYAFYAQHRLLYQAQRAYRRGLITQRDLEGVERIASRLPEWVPPQPPSLLHGDLWSGNATTDAHGGPAIVDPAVYYGWAEADLAMTALFGRFPEAFYRAYQEVRPLEPGWEERFSLYNLYHLLNHVNLFGSGYLSETRSVIRYWAGK